MEMLKALHFITKFMLKKCLTTLEFWPLRLYTSQRALFSAQRLWPMSHVTHHHRYPGTWCLSTGLWCLWWPILPGSAGASHDIMRSPVTWPHPCPAGQHRLCSSQITSMARQFFISLLIFPVWILPIYWCEMLKSVFILMSAGCPLQSCPCPVLALGPHVKFCKM